MSAAAEAGVPGAFVELAGRLADAAGPILKRHYRSGGAIQYKADASPVSDADRESEAAMREILEAEVPDHGIVGEEHGTVRADSEYVWVLDPLDGTQAFVTGKPTFGVLVALARRGAPVLGVSDQPILGERWIGAAGRPTRFNGETVTTRNCPELDQAWLYATSPQMFEGPDLRAFENLRGHVRRAVYGGECYAYGLLASGFVDLVVEGDLAPYDYMALVPVVRGAGGVMSDWAGRALDLSSDGRVIAAGDGRAHAAALGILGDGGGRG